VRASFFEKGGFPKCPVYSTLTAPVILKVFPSPSFSIRPCVQAEVFCTQI
jgi:hypothetical protein